MSETTPISFGRSLDGYVIRVTGRGTMRESPAFRDLAERCLDEEVESVVVDLTDCEYLDSTFLGCLVSLHRHDDPSPPQFLVAADDVARRRLLAPTHLDQVLECIESTPQPTSELVSLETPSLDKDDLARHVLEAHRRLASLGGDNARTFQPVADRLAAELEGRGR